MSKKVRSDESNKAMKNAIEQQKKKMADIKELNNFNTFLSTFISSPNKFIDAIKSDFNIRLEHSVDKVIAENYMDVVERIIKSAKWQNLSLDQMLELLKSIVFILVFYNRVRDNWKEFIEFANVYGIEITTPEKDVGNDLEHNVINYEVLNEENDEEFEE